MDRTVDVGGLVGYNLYGTVSDDFAAGSVNVGTSSFYVGGLVGDNLGTVTNSFWDFQVNPGLNGIGGGVFSGAIGLTTAQIELCTLSGCGMVTVIYVDPVSSTSVYGSAPAITYTLVNASGSPDTDQCDGFRHAGLQPLGWLLGADEHEQHGHL